MDQDSLAVLMWTNFVALKDNQDWVLGAVKAGECFDFRGIVTYRNREVKFSEIRVAYNSFTHTDLLGTDVSPDQIRFFGVYDCGSMD